MQVRDKASIESLHHSRLCLDFISNAPRESEKAMVMNSCEKTILKIVSLKGGVASSEKICISWGRLLQIFPFKMKG